MLEGAVNNTWAKFSAKERSACIPQNTSQFTSDNVCESGIKSCATSAACCLDPTGERWRSSRLRYRPVVFPAELGWTNALPNGMDSARARAFAAFISHCSTIARGQGDGAPRGPAEESKANNEQERRGSKKYALALKEGRGECNHDSPG